MKPKPTLLIVDDERQIRKLIRAAVVSHDYLAIEAESALEAIQLMQMHPPTLVIMDLSLPDKNGLALLKEMRQMVQLPIIVVSTSDQERIKIEALEAGADDYLTKPFNVSDLLTRIKVALRHASDGGKSIEDFFEYEGLVFDSKNHNVMHEGKEVHLNATEYKLLSCMVHHAGKIVTHNQLQNEVWGDQATTRGHYLRIHMQHLRQKLGDDVLNPKYLVTETGVGYRLKTRDGE